MDLWYRVIERRRAGISSSAMNDIDATPASGSTASNAPTRSPIVLWDMVLARRLAAQFPEEVLDAAQVGMAALSTPNSLLPPPPAHPPLLLQWYDTLAIPATPVVDDAAPEADETAADLGRSIPAPSLQGFNALGEEHEDAARKQCVRRKRAVDSAFKARRSSRLAAKEPDNFVPMLAKAKAVKASRFDFAGGSPRLQAAAVAADFGDGAPKTISLPRLKALAAACGVDPERVSDDASVPSSSGC
jgi:hypothetical protein